MIVGEAPGAKEAELGRPFVGRSGQRLNEMLESAGMKRDDVYITNIVKARPPENRDPTEQEKSACSKWLLWQIKLIKPTLICPLGNHASGFFIDDFAGISKCHGTLFEGKGFGVFPMYHPAVSLYNPKMKVVLFKDFAKASSLNA